MTLHAISYTSSTTRIPCVEDFLHLLDCARERNRRENVTGVLLYADGCFHQYIEGPEDGLQRVWEVIVRDARHQGIFEFIREPIREREFSDWALGYRGSLCLPPAAGDEQLTRMLLDEHPRSMSAGRLLLNAFWAQLLARRSH